MEPITLDELLSAIEQASCDPGDGYTIAEIIEHTGLSLNRARTIVKHAIRFGRMKPGRKVITSMDGRRMMVPAYVLIQ